MPYYTHAGLFHADEVTGFAICKFITEDVVRLDNIENIPEGGIIADIGREYNPGKRKFDHHQGLIFRDNGYPYASAGLLWKHYGEELIENLGYKEWIDEIHKRVDIRLIQGIDAHDSDNKYELKANCSAGDVNVMSLSNIVSCFNSTDVFDAKTQLSRFKQAAKIVEQVIKHHIESAHKYWETRSKFQIDIQENVGILHEGLPWKEIVHELYPDLDFIISPSNHPGNPWSMLAVPVTPTSREVKVPIERPDWFSGFIHQGKWIAGANSPEELLKLANFQKIQTNS